MKIGLIARAEDRGLGNLTREWYRNMQPDRTLVVRPVAADQADLAMHEEWYPGEIAMRWHPQQLPLNEGACRAWLDGLDVVYSAETFYDWRFCEWARELGVRTVCHLMPEYWRAENFTAVDRWWTPTRWRLAKLPQSVRVVPVPAPLDRFPTARFDVAHTPITWLHPGGARAHKDRNGTMQFVRALRFLTGRHNVTVSAQELLGRPDIPKNVTLEVRDARTVENYWDVYRDIDAVVLPRKYGGLSLPATEAMSAGCALVMTDTPPQRDEWPIIAIPSTAEAGGELRVYDHRIPLVTAQPEDIAAVMDRVAAADPAMLFGARLRAFGWARQNSWDQLRPLIVSELEDACG